MRLSDLGPRQTHLTHSLPPVVGTPERERRGQQWENRRWVISVPPRVGAIRAEPTAAHHVLIPGDLRCPVCLAVHLPVDWPALGLGPSLQPPASTLQRLQGSSQVHEGLGCCP